jgi:hypothetical protein
MSTTPEVQGRRILRCAKCGSPQNVELHHIAGRNHVVWITIPLCREHHVRLTVAIQQAGIDMRYTSDTAERLRRARRAIYVCLWLLDDAVTANPRSA